jgi:cell division protein FtsW
MTTLRRVNHPVYRWWWTIDRSLVAALLCLMAIGAVLVTASSPPVAERINLDAFYFVKRQQIYLGLAFLVMLCLSLFTPKMVRRFSLLGLIGSIALLLVLPLVGTEIKGATRWINLMGVSIQPSEFLKPFFAVVTAWIFTLQHRNASFPAFKYSLLLFAFCSVLLISQPDFGMTVTLSVIWGVQIFLAGLPLIWVGGLLLMAVTGVVAAYQFLPHVTARIDRFLDPTSGDNFQVDKSLEAFQNGGLLGRGPGEGEVKIHLPDSHTDFIFAVAAEEFGLFFCLLIVGLFLFVVLKSVSRLWEEREPFVLIATAGLLTQFAMQALINMGVAVQMFPAKGMTLPFLSYGGSSALSMALCMGMVLALTRKRIGERAL